MPGSYCISCRCSPKYFREFLGGLGLDDSHFSHFRKTPFFNFLDLPPICTERPLLDALLGCWDEKSQSFNLGPKLIKFTAKDVALVLGLKLHGVPVILGLKNRNSMLWRKYFKNLKITRKTLEEILSSLAHAGESSLEDFTKILVLFLFQQVLFPQTSYTLKASLVDYVDDLPSLENYSWAEAVYRNMLNEINSGAAAVQARELGNKRTAGYFGACSIVLRAWFYEHACIEPPTKLGNIEFPRLWKWVNSTHKQRKTIAKEIEKLQFQDILDDLIPYNDTEAYIIEYYQGAIAYGGYMHNYADRLLHEASPLPAHPSEGGNDTQRTKLLSKRYSGGKEKKSPHIFQNLASPYLTLSSHEKENEEVSEGEASDDNGKEKAKSEGEAGDDKDKEKVTLEGEAGHDNEVEEDEGDRALILPILAHREKKSFVLWRHHDIKLTKDGFLSLADRTAWMCDEAIDAYGARMLILQARGGVYTTRFHYVTTIAIQLLKTKHDKSHVPCVYKDMKLDKVQVVFFPINRNNNHWTLLVADVKKQSFVLYNSVENNTHHTEDAKYLIKKLGPAFKKQGYSANKWKLVAEENRPMQVSTDDCGVFVLKYMDCLARGVPFDFAQKDVRMLRTKIAAQFIAEQNDCLQAIGAKAAKKARAQ